MFLYEVYLCVLFLSFISCDPALNLTNQHFQSLKGKTLFNVSKRNVSGILQSPNPYVSIKVIAYHYAKLSNTRMNLHFGQCNLNLTWGFFGGKEQLFKIYQKKFKNPTYIEVQQAGITVKSKDAEPYDIHCDVEFHEVSSIRPNYSLYVAVMAVKAIPVAIYYLNTSLYVESKALENTSDLRVDDSTIIIGIVYCAVGSTKKESNIKKKTSTQKRTSKSKTTTTKKKTATSKSKSKSKGTLKKSGKSNTANRSDSKKKKKVTKSGTKNRKKLAPKRQPKTSTK
ncbi:hypothetical protein M3Y96_00284700 [Aphelenchoides besseyi]|nr:hypothetical protein M3Y96_00284700 [Aphelenchoides besseyi]